jgi:uncharacterized Zn finger protein
MRKKGVDIQPIGIEGRKIAKTFWGEAWCKHMDAQGDFANRLPRGRTYVRNGSVCHLKITKGKIEAIVSGSELYNVKIDITPLPAAKWEQVKQQSSGQIGSLMELLQGKISKSVMQVVTDARDGLFPQPKEIKLRCDCPDYATMCKHAAAVLYGVGARLDHQPELLFQLRGVNHLDLITASADQAVSEATNRGGSRRQVAAGDLGDVFGIDLDEDQTDSKIPSAKAIPKSVAANKKASPKKKSSRKKKATKASTKSAVAKKKTVKKKAAKKKSVKNKTVKKKAAKKKSVKKKAATKKTSVKKKASRRKAPAKRKTKQG